MKRCTKCERKQADDHFYVNHRVRNGHHASWLSSRCKECICAGLRKIEGHCSKCRAPEPPEGFSPFAVRCGDLIRFKKRGMCNACLERRDDKEYASHREDVEVVQAWIHRFVSTDTQCQNYLMAKGA